jgi:uncharacterized Zn-finger protein
MDIFDYYDIIYFPIINTQYVCPIIQTVIKEHDFYCRCDKCKTPMSHTGLIKWFNQIPRNGIKSCPYCQTQWTNWKIYVNSGSELKKTNELNNSTNTEFSEISSQANKRRRILGGFGAIIKQEQNPTSK